MAIYTEYQYQQQSLLHSRRQTYPSKTDDPTNPRLWRCHLQNCFQHSTQQTGCSLSQCHPFCHQSPHILPTTAACMLSLAGPHYISVTKPTDSRSSMSLLGKAPPYLSSLVTITAPTRSTCSSRYDSLVIPKANTYFGRLSFQFSAINDRNNCKNR